MLDFYCERCGPGLLAEPLNATTNLAFLVAALAAGRMARRMGRFSPGIALLVALSATVGVGTPYFIPSPRPGRTSWTWRRSSPSNSSSCGCTCAAASGHLRRGHRGSYWPIASPA